MKLIKRTWSHLVALAVMSSGLFITLAFAAPLQTVTSGGITCGQYTRGAGFPATYWDCITPNTNTSNALTAANAANGLPVTVKTALTAANAQIYLFNSPTDYANFSGGNPIVGAFGAIHTGSPNDGTVKMAAIFKTAIVAQVNTDMSAYYSGNILQQLGRIYGPMAPVNLKPTDPFFIAAVQDDFLALSNNTGRNDQPDYPSSQAVWGATIAAQYPGKSPWEILGLRYSSTYYDKTYLYGLQIGRQNATPTEPALNTFLQNYMRTTRNWVSQQVYAVSPQVYKVANNVLCVETGGVNVYPLKWWSCVRPYTPSLFHQFVKTYPNTLPFAWQTLLKNAKVQVYAMRNIDAFVSFFGGTRGGLNILGISTYGATPNSAAFADTFTSYNPGPPIVYTFDNTPIFMAGTILHELGHQFDKTIWGNISTANSAAVLGSVRWQIAVNADITAFNALNCATAIDKDRTDNKLPPICGSKPNATSNFSWLGTNGLIGSTTNPELWARAFARRAGGEQPKYAKAVQFRLGTNMHIYMNDLWTTGAPHN